MAGTEAFRQRSAEDIATEKIIRSIAVSLDSPEAVGVISEESLGGNAGRTSFFDRSDDITILNIMSQTTQFL
jgi:nitrous oxide reductase